MDASRGARRATCSTSLAFRDINFVAPKHAIDPFSDATFLGRLNEEHESVTGDPVLGVVEANAHSLCGEMLTSFRVIRKQVLQMQVA
jgi:hypothetical protein